MGNNRSDVEAQIRGQFNPGWVIFDGEFSVASVIAEGIADWATDGSYEQLPESNATSAAENFGIDLVQAIAENGFNPATDTFYGATMTFQNWQDLVGGLTLPLPNKFVPFIAVKKGAGSGGGTLPSIRVRFTNKTNVVVSFFLNGGAGLNFSLSPGTSESFNVIVDRDVQPIVGINQLEGGRLNFTIANQTSYAFEFQNGKIVNAFDTAARTRWRYTNNGGGVFQKLPNGNWQEAGAGVFNFIQDAETVDLVGLFDGSRTPSVNINLYSNRGSLKLLGQPEIENFYVGQWEA